MDEKELSKRMDDMLAETREAAMLSVRLINPISLYVKDRPWVKIRSLLPINGGARCSTDDALDIAGRSQTGANGRMTWRLTDFICRGHVPVIDPPISFVATPLGNRPIILTTGITVPNPPSDLLVEVYTWELAGGPAANVLFSWRCRLRYEEYIPPIG